MSELEERGKDYGLGRDAKRLLKGAFRSLAQIKSIYRLGTDEGHVVVEAGGVRSYALDALGNEVEGTLGVDAARQFVEGAAQALFTAHPAVGMGDEVRLTAGTVGA